jgi:hypothetical protein
MTQHCKFDRVRVPMTVLLVRGTGILQDINEIDANDNCCKTYSKGGMSVCSSGPAGIAIG